MSNLDKLVEMGLALYGDACAYEAAAAFGDDPDMSERAVVAWSRYDGAKTLLSMVFKVSERQVDEDMEQLMFSNLFE